MHNDYMCLGGPSKAYIEASLGWTAFTKRVWDGSVYLTMDSFLTMQIDVCFIRNLKPADLGGLCAEFLKNKPTYTLLISTSDYVTRIILEIRHNI